MPEPSPLPDCESEPVMDIEEFYDADPRRRESEEVEFGRDWTDVTGARAELSWVVDTGELYLMQEPNAPIYMDPVGDTIEQDLPTETLVVQLLGVVETREQVDEILSGWQEAMPTLGSLMWVKGRFARR
jgi:hypothetical protein